MGDEHVSDLERNDVFFGVPERRANLLDDDDGESQKKKRKPSGLWSTTTTKKLFCCSDVFVLSLSLTLVFQPLFRFNKQDPPPSEAVSGSSALESLPAVSWNALAFSMRTKKKPTKKKLSLLPFLDAAGAFFPFSLFSIFQREEVVLFLMRSGKKNSPLSLFVPRPRLLIKRTTEPQRSPPPR